MQKRSFSSLFLIIKCYGNFVGLKVCRGDGRIRKKTEKFHLACAQGPGDLRHRTSRTRGKVEVGPAPVVDGELGEPGGQGPVTTHSETKVR